MEKDQGVVDEGARYSRQQPGWHVCVLSIFTFGIYNVYWFFKNLQYLHEQTSPENQIFCEKHPFFASFLFLIPVVNLIIALHFFAQVGELLPDKESFWHKNKYFCAFLISAIFGALCLLTRLPEPYNLLYLLTALPLALVQTGINQYWGKVEQNGLLVRTAFNPIELVVIFFGAGVLGLCAIGPSVLHH